MRVPERGFDRMVCSGKPNSGRKYENTAIFSGRIILRGGRKRRAIYGVAGRYRDAAARSRFDSIGDRVAGRASVTVRGHPPDNKKRARGLVRSSDLNVHHPGMAEMYRLFQLIALRFWERLAQGLMEPNPKARAFARIGSNFFKRSVATAFGI